MLDGSCSVASFSMIKAVKFFKRRLGFGEVPDAVGLGFSPCSCLAQVLLSLGSLGDF